MSPLNGALDYVEIPTTISLLTELKKTHKIIGTSAVVKASAVVVTMADEMADR